VNVLDEKSLRRPEWREGEWVTLGDGGRWCLPKPQLTFYPTTGSDGVDRFDDGQYGLDATYEARVEAFMQADQDNALDTMLALALDLFRRNYTATPDVLRILFPWRTGDESNAEMWRSIVDVAMGRAPKPTAGGSDSR
jgi:hypothetical protein